MNARTELLMKAREAGREGRPCPVVAGDVSAEGLAVFHAWLLAGVVQETGAVVRPEYAESEHPDLRLCRPSAKEAL